MAVADGTRAGPSAGDDRPATGRPVRLALGVAGAWLGAVLVARLLLAGGAGWVGFALLLPFLLALLGRRLGLVPALVLVALFAAATLALRALLVAPRVAWGPILLAPVLMLSAGLALRVAAALRSPTRTKEK